MTKVEQIIEDFIKELQWDLRSSYNSSSCLNDKQCSFLKDALDKLVFQYEEKLDRRG